MGLNRVHRYNIGDRVLVKPLGYPYYLVGTVAEKVFNGENEAGYFLMFEPPHFTFSGYYHQNRCSYYAKEKEETE